MLPQWIIEKKRDGRVLTDEEIRFFVDGYTEGSIPDYQMAALAMAIFLRGMTPAETAALTEAMMASGEIVDASSISRYKADKHSTGGIGDKVSLILAPLVACLDVAVPMISGRGLGLTGGTLDKLESIAGYRTHLSMARFLGVVAECGCSIVGPTDEMVPADRKLYALRDVTGTVPSIPLISASIMSKKLAEGIDGLVLDVKWGRGAFMRTREEAMNLAETMIEIGTRMNRDMAAVLTNMDQPLGRCAGNAVEVAETVEALQGRGPEDLMRVTLALGARMLIMAGRSAGEAEAEEMLRETIASGAALDKFRRMVRLHGGDERFLDDPARLPRASIRHDYVVPTPGYVTAVDAEKIGRACVALGAGRRTVTDAVDHAVGLTDIVKIGERVERDRPAFVVWANSEEKLAAALALLDGAVETAGAPSEPPPLLGETLEALRQRRVGRRAWRERPAGSPPRREREECGPEAGAAGRPKEGGQRIARRAK